MSTETVIWKSVAGVEIFARCWKPDGEIKAAVVHIHGHGEHSGRYDAMMKFLNTKGIAVLSPDLPGHGKSGGKRGHIANVNLFYEVLGEAITQARLRFPSTPLFLYGHSMGGNIAANFLIRKKPNIKGAILTGSLFRLAFDPPKLKVLLAKAVVNIFPGLTQSTKLDAKLLSHDPEVVKAYQTDPLVHDKMSPVLFLEMMENGEWAISHAPELQIPTLVMHGGDDGITSTKSSQAFAKNAGKMATCKVWEGMFHEIHFETNKEEVWNFIADWIISRLSQSPSA